MRMVTNWCPNCESLARQLAAEREARQKAEVACAALRDGIRGVSYLSSHDFIMADIEALLAAENPGADLLADVYRVAQAALKRCVHDPECTYHRNHDYCDCGAGAPLDDEDYQDVVAIIRRRGWDRLAEGEGESDEPTSR